MGQIENKLKDILEILKAGGGGGGGSGIPTYELEQYDSRWCAITIQNQDEDPFRNPNLFRVRHNNESVIVIGSIGNGINVLSLVTDGHTIARGDWSRSTFAGYPRQYRCEDYRGTTCSPLDLTKNLYIEEPFTPATNNYMILTQDEYNSGYVWMDGTEWAERAGIKPASIDIIDLSSAASAINQILTAIKQIASASKGTTVNKYYPLDETMTETVSRIILSVASSVVNRQRVAAIKINNEIGLVSESAYNYFSFHYSEWDFTNNLQYDFKMTFAPSNIYIQCTCHEATSLM